MASHRRRLRQRNRRVPADHRRRQQRQASACTWQARQRPDQRCLRHLRRHGDGEHGAVLCAADPAVAGCGRISATDHRCRIHASEVGRHGFPAPRASRLLIPRADERLSDRPRTLRRSAGLPNSSVARRRQASATAASLNWNRDDAEIQNTHRGGHRAAAPIRWLGAGAGHVGAPQQRLRLRSRQRLRRRNHLLRSLRPGRAARPPCQVWRSTRRAGRKHHASRRSGSPTASGVRCPKHCPSRRPKSSPARTTSSTLRGRTSFRLAARPQPGSTIRTSRRCRKATTRRSTRCCCNCPA